MPLPSQPDTPTIELHFSKLPKTCKLYLVIPLALISTLCLYPVKWLHFVGHVILGVPGYVSNAPDGSPINDEDQDALEAGKGYYFVHNKDPEDLDLIDIDIIEGGYDESYQSDDANSEDETYEQTVRRDGRCVFTGAPATYSSAVHFVPHATDQEDLHLQRISARYRTKPGIQDIDDIRNCLVTDLLVEISVKRRTAVILKTPTPNDILQMSDIPSSPARPSSPGVASSTNARYTLQWLDTDIRESIAVCHTRIFIRNDASFRDISPENAPSGELLEYVYGLSVLRQFGHNVKTMKERNGPQSRRVVRTSVYNGRDEEEDGLLPKLRRVAFRQSKYN